MKLNKIFELGIGTNFRYKGLPACVNNCRSWNEYVGETQKGVKLFDRGFVVYFSCKEFNIVLRTNHPDTTIVEMPDYEV